MSEDRSEIELEVEVVGTPEEVWRAIATGPGISSWYVPHVVEEREGGDAIASFGPEPEMQAPGRVAAWEPPRRIVFDGGEGVGGLAFEWLVEAKEEGTCIVRLVNSGFGSGEPWDDQYDAMEEGWGIFLENLRLHLLYFSGQTAKAMLPLGSWEGPRDETWAKLTDALGINPAPAVGDRVETTVEGDLTLGGVVRAAAPHRLTLLLDEPAAGTGFIAAEGRGDRVEVSIWSYLYGERGAEAVERDDPRWRSWLAERSIDSTAGG